MSPSGTMARVYQGLKARVMAGDFAPGERIDPAKLSIELAASATPIRDALYRLAGERLVESWQHEGFRQPLVTEAGLRDLYGWSEDVVLATVRAAARRSDIGVQDDTRDARAASDDTTIVFERLARLSPNDEHRLAIASLNERSCVIRRVEARLLDNVAAETAVAMAMLDQFHWSEFRRWSARYHAARVRRVPEIAAAFRRRDG